MTANSMKMPPTPTTSTITMMTVSLSDSFTAHPPVREGKVEGEDEDKEPRGSREGLVGLRVWYGEFVATVSLKL